MPVAIGAGLARHGRHRRSAWLLDRSYGVLLALLLAAPLLALAGLVAALVTVAAKWLLVGRLRPGAHPLWSSFVWRNELADTFVEVVAAPWFARAVAGTPLLNVWFRLMGAKIGRGVWCETYWLPETDLVELGDGATVNQGTVVQTHLFHDRMLAMDRVILKRGATLGPNSVILPAATLGRHATVGPVSLVMRGESVPDKTVWIGNPIGPWAVRRVRLPGHLRPADRRPVPPRPRRPRLECGALRARPRLRPGRQPAPRRGGHRRHRRGGRSRRVVLDLAGLDVAKVTVDGRAPAKYATRGNRLVVTLRAPVAAGAAFRLVVKYAGAPRPLIDKHHGDAGWEELPTA